MTEKTINIIAWTSFVIMMFMSGITIGSIIGNNHGYKRGQIDAINSVIKYELIEHEDFTRTWEQINDEKGK